MKGKKRENIWIETTACAFAMWHTTLTDIFNPTELTERDACLHKHLE